MNILHLCNKPPYPPMDGGAIGMNNVTRGLIDCGNQVKVLSVETPKHPVNRNAIPIQYFEKTNAEYIFINTDIRPVKAFLNLFSTRSYNIDRFYSKTFVRRLEEVMASGNYDLVLLESIFLAPYIPHIRQCSNAVVVLRAPNVEHLIWKRLAEEEARLLKKIYLRLLARRLEKAERAYSTTADALITVTPNDLEHFRKMGCDLPGRVIPTGIDMTKSVDIQTGILPNSVFHLGAMDWKPNIEGIEWFIKDVWPDIIKIHPDAVLHLAGRNMPKSFYRHSSANIIIAGEVEDAAAFMADKQLMVVPLYSGSGMRVKIVEGMRMGRVIITTDIGIEGIIHTPGQDILIANTAHEFTAAILRCLENPETSNKISKRAKESAIANYDNRQLSVKIHAFFEELTVTGIKSEVH